MSVDAYTMERTQIHLTRRESAALARLSKETGRTRSQLIREAIATQYLGESDAVALADALAATVGLWADRAETGERYVNRVRSGRLARLHEAPPDQRSWSSTRPSSSITCAAIRGRQRGCERPRKWGRPLERDARPHRDPRGREGR